MLRSMPAERRRHPRPRRRPDSSLLDTSALSDVHAISTMELRWIGNGLEIQSSAVCGWKLARDYIKQKDTTQSPQTSQSS